MFYPMLSIRPPELRETIFKLKTDASYYIRKKCVLLTDVGVVKIKHKKFWLRLKYYVTWPDKIYDFLRSFPVDALLLEWRSAK